MTSKYLFTLKYRKCINTIFIFAGLHRTMRFIIKVKNISVIFHLFASLILVGVVDYCGGSSKINRRDVHGLLGSPPLPTKTVLPPDLWFTQILDHFRPTNAQERFWRQVTTQFTGVSFIKMRTI